MMRLLLGAALIRGRCLLEGCVYKRMAFKGNMVIDYFGNNQKQIQMIATLHMMTKSIIMSKTAEVIKHLATNCFEIRKLATTG